MSEVIYATWCLSENFGDKLTPYIIERLSSKKCVYSPPDSDLLKYVVTGSILNWDIKNAVVWGAGIANKTDDVLLKKTIAVRGGISFYMAVVGGSDVPVAIGDPALLLPRMFNPKVKKSFKIGIFPHYIDSDIVHYYLSDKLPSDVLIIDALAPVEEIIHQICSCEKIISSSLHGLIASDAYGVATRWVRFSDRILGDGTKFLDYYNSISNKEYYPVDLRSNVSIESVRGVSCSVKKINIDLDLLLKSCPFNK